MADYEVQDRQLREHPTHTIRRLRASGVWADAERLLRSIKQRYRNRLAESGGAPTVEQRLEMNAAAWNAVHDRWPPPPGTAPLRSLAEYLRGTRGAFPTGTDRTDRLPPLSVEAQRRFNAIGHTNDPAGEILWVYHHRDDDPPDSLTCPSRGAWGLLELARSKPPEWFMEKMFRPVCGAMAKKKKEIAESGRSKQEMYCRAEIEKMIVEAMAESQEQAPTRSLNFARTPPVERAKGR